MVGEPYDILAEVRLTHPDLVLYATIRSHPHIDIEVDHQPNSADAPPILFFSASGDGFDAFESALDDDPSITDCRVVDTSATRRVYRAHVAEAAKRVTPICTGIGAYLLSVRSDPDGWTLRMRLPSRESLVAFNDHCRDEEISCNVTKLRESDSSPDDNVLGLSQKQKTILQSALAGGYYDVPRGVSQLELADELDISKSAISQRLRRATAQLVTSTLSVDPDDDRRR